MDDTERKILELPCVKEVLEQIGLVTIAWNSIETLWYLIYTVMLYEPPRDKVDQIFKQFPTGSSKRQMVIDLAELTFTQYPMFLKEIKSLKNKSDKLSSDRNNIIHGVYSFDYLNGEPGLRVAPMGSMNKKENSLAKYGTGLVEELKSILEKVNAHEKELEDFRLILIQEFLPDGSSALPLSEEALESMPEDVLSKFPR